MNQWLRHTPRCLDIPPPVLSYPERNEVAPTRLQPMADPGLEDRPLSDLPRDLSDLEAIERLRRPALIGPRLSGPDPEYLLSYRPLLPRHYRDFLRHSPYPRVALGTIAVATAVGGLFWLSSLQQAEATAAGRARAAQNTVQAQLTAARRFGLDPQDLHRLETRAHALRLQDGPGGLPGLPLRLYFYRGQERGYRSLLREIRRLEHRAMKTWASREARTYVALAKAVQKGKQLGLAGSRPPIPSCATPACYQQVVRRQTGEIRVLQQTTHMLRRYSARMKKR
jgi:hypothetical protein